MTLRVKTVVGVVIAGGIVSLWSTLGHGGSHWLYFFVYLTVVLLSSGMKVALPKAEGTASVNFPFILLGILQLSPVETVGLAVCSVVAQCNFRVIKPFTLLQVLFNMANVTTATVLAWFLFSGLSRHHWQMAPALGMAGLLYFFATCLPVSLIVAWNSETPVLERWRKEFLWYLPFYLVGAMLAAVADQIKTSYGWMTSLLLIPLVYTIYRAYTAQRTMAQDRERHIQENEALHLRTIEGLAMAIEAKDQNTHEHLLRVRVYCTEIGKRMKLDGPTMQALQTASFLHDIGKLAVPEHIINKPGKLTPEEFEKMKIHPVVGADILERVRFPYPVVPIVRAHHEAWDGSGYPDGLKGEEIPLAARILTAVDCFDALASDRPYRKAMSLEDAMALVLSKAGTQFDPQVVEVLAEMYVELEAKARSQMASMHPLDTNLSIARGAAPGAGFEAEATAHESETAPAMAASLASSAAAYPPLNLIAAAGQEAKAVFELSQMLGSSLSAHETSSMMFRRLRLLVPFDCMAIYLKAEETLVPHFLDGECTQAFSASAIKIGEGLSGWVAHSGRPLLNGNPTVEENYLPHSGLFSASSSALSIPLCDLHGVIFGALTLYARSAAAFSKDHLRILQAIESKFSLSLQNALRFSLAESDARTDRLTRMPNMRGFLEQVDQELQRASLSGDRFGVAVCDLNSFKAVNDRHGHLTGDRLLSLIADAFRRICDSADRIGRLGGDEFVFLFRATDVDSAHQRLWRVEAAVQEACVALQLEIAVSTSVGMAFFPEDGTSTEELLGAADRRMYQQKQSFYDIVQQREASRQSAGAAVA